MSKNIVTVTKHFCLATVAVVFSTVAVVSAYADNIDDENTVLNTASVLTMNEQSRDAAISQTLGLFPPQKGLKVDLVVADAMQSIKLSFKAQNTQQYKTLKAKVADIDYEAQIMEIKKQTDFELPALGNERDLDGIVVNKDLVSEDVSNLLSKYPLALSTNIKNQAEELLLRLRRFGDAEFGSTAIEDTQFKIEEGLKTLKKYKTFAGETSINPSGLEGYLTESLDELAMQVNFDQEFSRQQVYIQDIYIKLFNEYPILSSSPLFTELSYNKPTKQEDLFLSRVYSTDHERTTNALTEWLSRTKNEPLLYDLMSIIVLGIAQGSDFPTVPSKLHHLIEGVPIFVERQEPLRFIQVLDKSELESVAGNTNHDAKVGGFYSPTYNLVVFTDGRSFIHEAMHATMNILYANRSNPYMNTMEGSTFEAYQSATRSILLRMLATFGISEADDRIVDKNTYKLIEVLKDNTPIVLFAISNNPSLLSNFWIKYNVWHKYFSETTSQDALTYEDVNSLIKKMINDDFSVSNIEFDILCEMAVLIYGYDQDEFDKELIAYIAHLIFEHNANHFVINYFKPILEYWNQYIHPVIQSQIETHNEQCNEDFCISRIGKWKNTDLLQAKTFNYCIEEYGF